jgi:hypothetical protein
MFDNRLTQEQVFRGIRIIWKEAVNEDTPLDLDANFFEEFKAGGTLEEIDLLDVIYRIEREFGFCCPGEEWNSLLGLPAPDPDEWERVVAPRLTFRALADFILERLTPISFEPITLLGKPCLTAGVFRGLEQLAGQVHPSVTQFGPSTPIRQRLRGLRLHRYWSRLRWIVNDQLPPPRQVTLRLQGFVRSLSFKGLIGGLIAMWRGDLFELAVGFVLTFPFLFIVAYVVEFINLQLNPLPEGIETFGDLARFLAAIIRDQQDECASCSTP